MNFRIFHFVAVCFAFLLMNATWAGAHPGGLDSKGGHHNKKTGEYHYHRGGPAPDSPKTAVSENKSERKVKAVQPDDSKKKKSKGR